MSSNKPADKPADKPAAPRANGPAARTSASALSTLRPVLVLVTICLVAGVLLGVVHDATAPLAQQNADERAAQTYAQILPEAASFEDVPCEVEGCTAALVATNEAGDVVGHVVVAESKGYGGEVPVAVAFGTDGTVAGIAAMANSETPGLGTRIADQPYIGQYLGRAAEPMVVDDIDCISGATISSKAALAAFNIAVEAYEEVR